MVAPCQGPQPNPSAEALCRGGTGDWGVGTSGRLALPGTVIVQMALSPAERVQKGPPRLTGSSPRGQATDGGPDRPSLWVLQASCAEPHPQVLRPLAAGARGEPTQLTKAGGPGVSAGAASGPGSLRASLSGSHGGFGGPWSPPGHSVGSRVVPVIGLRLILQSSPPLCSPKCRVARTCRDKRRGASRARAPAGGKTSRSPLRRPLAPGRL